MIFLPARARRSPLLLAAPLACGLAAVAVAFAALWGLARAGREVPVELPAVEAGAGRAGPAFSAHVIVVRAAGGYLLGGERLPRAELKRRLDALGERGAAGGEHVLVRAAAAAPFRRIADLMEICRRAGLGSVRFEVVEGSPR